MTQEKYTFAQRFATWFGLAGLIFGAFCGGSTAAGAYATAYFACYGGGWMFAFILIYNVLLGLACGLGLHVVKSYNCKNYKEFYHALYGVQGEDANPVVKKAVTLFFDAYTILKGITSCAAAMALIGTLFNSMLGWDAKVGAFIGVIIFAILTMYGGTFLRRFNSAITFGLLVSLLAILVAVFMHRGDVLTGLLFDFETGVDWTGATLSAGFAGVIAYCSNVTSWGGTLASYSERIRDGKDVVGSGITIGLIVPTLFLLTSMIVLPYLPEELHATPIINIITNHLQSPILLVVYYVVIVLSAISTGPAFTFSITDRFEKIWKNPNISVKTKNFVIAMVFLLICWVFSNFGLMFLVKSVLGATGTISIVAILLPLFIAIPRIEKKKKLEKAALEAGK